MNKAKAAAVIPSAAFFFILPAPPDIRLSPHVAVASVPFVGVCNAVPQALFAVPDLVLSTGATVKMRRGV